MTTLTWQTVIDRTRRFLSDQVVQGRTPRVSDQELCDAWTDAQDDLVLYAARPATFEIAAGLQQASLPDTLYRIDFVRNADGWTMLPLDAHEVDDMDLWEGMFWYATHTTIEFTDALDYAATVHYRAYYPAPTVAGLTTEILVPRWAIQPCVYYVSAQCIEKQVVADPQLRQYASKIQDAGSPRDNPFLQVADYLMRRYREQVTARAQDRQERATWPS